MIRNILLMGLVLILSACGDPYEQGSQAFQQGNWEEAIEKLRRVRRASGDIDQAQELISRAHFQLGKEACAQQDWDTALQELGEVSRSDPDYQEARDLTSSAHFTQAQTAYDAGNHAEALIQLQLVKRDWDRYEEAQLMLEQVKEVEGAGEGE
jgi:tetratricopeptide (TPR) repeat protein